MKLTLKDFILDWNKSHNRFSFWFQEIPGTGRPAEVGVRYTAVKYRDFYSTDEWNRLRDIVDATIIIRNGMSWVSLDGLEKSFSLNRTRVSKDA